MKMKKLTPAQIMVLTVSGILGVDILMVQHKMTSIAGIDAWISLALGGMLVFVAAIPLIYLMNTYPDKDTPQIILAVAGKWIGRIALVPLIVFFVVYAGFSARIFAQVLKLFLIDRTPMLIIVGFMVIVAVYLVDKGVYTLGAVLDILFPLYMITLILLILLSLPQADPSNIRPILFKNTDNVIKGIIPGFYHFTGYGVISYFMCYVQDRKAAVMTYIIGLGIPIFFYFVLTIICIMVFGAAPLGIILYPTLNLSKSVEFYSAILDRLESFMATFWISMVFASLAIFTYASVSNISEFFSIPNRGRKYVVYAHLIILPVVGFIIPNDLEVIEFYHKSKYIDVIMAFVLIPILALWAGIKKKRRAGQG